MQSARIAASGGGANGIVNKELSENSFSHKRSAQKAI